MELRLIEIIRLCLKYCGTDISFKLENDKMDIFVRVEGKDRKIRGKLEDYKLIRYLQYLANLDVSNLLTPQTGTFELIIDEKLISFRVAVINSLNNSQAVLRILNVDNQIVYTQEEVTTFQNEFGKKGLYLISGPTGSGKTTLAYNILKNINDAKCYSIEDPIEKYLDNVIQIQENAEAGLTMKDGIYRILKHNPEIIFVGEIRDTDTAKAVLSAAALGHTVLATIHASSCDSAITKMVELGVNEETLLSNLCSIINLRLDKSEDGPVLTAKIKNKF